MRITVGEGFSFVGGLELRTGSQGPGWVRDGPRGGDLKLATTSHSLRGRARGTPKPPSPILSHPRTLAPSANPGRGRERTVPSSTRIHSASSTTTSPSFDSLCSLYSLPEPPSLSRSKAIAFASRARTSPNCWTFPCPRPLSQFHCRAHDRLSSSDRTLSCIALCAICRAFFSFHCSPGQSFPWRLIEIWNLNLRPPFRLSDAGELLSLEQLRYCEYLDPRAHLGACSHVHLFRFIDIALCCAWSGPIRASKRR